LVGCSGMTSSVGAGTFGMAPPALIGRDVLLARIDVRRARFSLHVPPCMRLRAAQNLMSPKSGPFSSRKQARKGRGRPTYGVIRSIMSPNVNQGWSGEAGSVWSA
jgi:hypothetical protein